MWPLSIYEPEPHAKPTGPDEGQALYELYRGAFVQNLSLATGHVVLDMSKEP